MQTGEVVKDEKGKPIVDVVEIGRYGMWDKEYPSNKNLKLFLSKKKINGLFEEADVRCLRWAKRMEQKGNWNKVKEAYPGIESVSELACLLLSKRVSKSINKGEIAAVIAEREMLPTT